MYAMYFKQPTKEYCKFRFTLDEWQTMTTFYNDIPKHEQARLVFWKLLQADAIQFVEAEHEYGFERFMHKDHCKIVAERKTDFKKFTPVIKEIALNMENSKTGLLPAINLLQMNYNEIKKNINVSSNSTTNVGASSLSSSSSGLLSNTEIYDDIIESIKNVKKNFNIETESEDCCEQIMDELGDDDEKSNDTDYARSNIINIGSRRIKLKKKSFQGKNDKKIEHEQIPNRCSVEIVGNSLQIHKPKLTLYPKGGTSAAYQLTVSE